MMVIRLPMASRGRQRCRKSPRGLGETTQSNHQSRLFESNMRFRRRPEPWAASWRLVRSADPDPPSRNPVGSLLAADNAIGKQEIIDRVIWPQAANNACFPQRVL